MTRAQINALINPLNADVGQKVETPMPFSGYNATGLFANQQNVALQAPALNLQPLQTGHQVDQCANKAGPLSMLELVKLHNLQKANTTVPNLYN